MNQDRDLLGGERQRFITAVKHKAYPTVSIRVKKLIKEALENKEEQLRIF